MVGLATAWFLQERGVSVTVIDREGVAAGASWGNAGWLTPGLATPLPEPAVLRYGVRALLSPSSPVYVPLRPDPRLLSFLTRFARNSTAARWRQAMRSLVPINQLALPAFDRLTAGGVDVPTREAAPFLAAFRTADERTMLIDEFAHIRACGQDVHVDMLTGAQARELEPALGDDVGAAIRLHGQRFIDPGAFVRGLADAVGSRGGTFHLGHGVTAVRHQAGQVLVETANGDQHTADAAVLANGAWLPHLARHHGVRTVVQAGRGYSFTVTTDRVPSGPLYFPTQRVACTPRGDRLRVAGMMEFRTPDAALDQRRVTAIAHAVRSLLDTADLDNRSDEWVGPRPCTPDGLPLIGRTRTPGVFVAGGHGMWGITLGPATGQLLSDMITTGRRPPELAPFEPTR